MAVLIPGGAGYIGSHTAYKMIDRGRDVVILDNLQTGHREAAHPRAKLYIGDIRDKAMLDLIFTECSVDAVIHFAANSQVGESVVKPLMYYDNNLYGTMVLLEAMQSHGVDKIVFSSTAATYGEPERVPIMESDRTQPTNPYGETKLGMEKMIKWVAAAGGPDYVSLRYFNACGARDGGAIGEDHDPETHLIPIILQCANGTRASVSIYGDDYDTPDGTCIRDYIHVDDLAEAHILALEYLEKGGANDVFNLGNGSGFSVSEVVRAAGDVAGKAIPFVMAPRRAGDPARLVASNDKARRVLRFDPKRPDLRDIIASAWEWHKHHPYGYSGGKR